MADALCGPSNPLQSLQKQTSVDRTLQQDRLTSRRTPIQGFRSLGPNAGILDPEFEAFQASQVSFPSPSTEHYGFNQEAFLSNHELQHMEQMHDSADWAGDFAKMNLSGPMVHPSTAVHVQHKAQNGRNSSWQREFSNQTAQSSNQRNLQYNPQLGGQAMGLGFAPMQRFGASPMGFQPQQSQQHQIQAGEEVFDEEAFARAFDEAESWQTPAADWEAEINQAIRDSDQTPLADWEIELNQAFIDSEREKEQKVQEEFELGQSSSINQLAENTLETPSPGPFQVTKRLGADLIINPITDLPPDQRPETNPIEDNDALARTAGHLLDSVSNDTSPKFQNSQFLRLMQQFRDREVAVKGDKIVENGMEGNGVEFEAPLDGKGKEVGAEVGVFSS